ncbi:MAG: hypothetical protein ABS81_23115 [Pseudonocardia sp. SCN 72-86]|nr:MAG: hypothetical protein ABS81_23115 [Pseudonocardia sp. SCN 72-86]
MSAGAPSRRSISFAPCSCTASAESEWARTSCTSRAMRARSARAAARACSSVARASAARATSRSSARRRALRCAVPISSTLTSDNTTTTSESSDSCCHIPTVSPAAVATSTPSAQRSGSRPPAAPTAR